jgi:hypothetical protein
MATSMVRVGIAWLAREVAISRFLAAPGPAAGEAAPVTRPSRDPDAGPFERAGLVISFWELEDVRAERPDPALAGTNLARLHARLRAFPRERLPEWGGFHEAREVLDRLRREPCAAIDRDDLARIEAAWERGERIVSGARARTASFQAVHGDAHIGNVLATSRGAVWTDWEDAYVGPVEIDIACLRSKADLFGEEREAIDAMTAAYAAAAGYDRGLAGDLLLVRNLQVIPWLAVFSVRDPRLVPRLRARLERLPAAPVQVFGR